MGRVDLRKRTSPDDLRLSAMCHERTLKHAWPQMGLLALAPGRLDNTNCGSKARSDGRSRPEHAQIVENGSGLGAVCTRKPSASRLFRETHGAKVIEKAGIERRVARKAKGASVRNAREGALTEQLRDLLGGFTGPP